MFAISEALAAAIRAVLEQRSDLSAIAELRRLTYRNAEQWPRYSQTGARASGVDLHIENHVVEWWRNDRESYAWVFFSQARYLKSSNALLSVCKTPHTSGMPTKPHASMR
jgi:hypothetical protein